MSFPDVPCFSQKPSASPFICSSFSSFLDEKSSGLPQLRSLPQPQRVCPDNDKLSSLTQLPHCALSSSWILSPGLQTYHSVCTRHITDVPVSSLWQPEFSNDRFQKWSLHFLATFFFIIDLAVCSCWGVSMIPPVQDAFSCPCSFSAAWLSSELSSIVPTMLLSLVIYSRPSLRTVCPQHELPNVYAWSS